MLAERIKSSDELEAHAAAAIKETLGGLEELRRDAAKATEQLGELDNALAADDVQAVGEYSAEAVLEVPFTNNSIYNSDEFEVNFLVETSATACKTCRSA